MNKRIRELVKQAGGHFSTHTLTSYPAQHRESIELWDKNIEKFVELIVRECAEVLDTWNKENGAEEGLDKAGLISLWSPHFGVEE